MYPKWINFHKDILDKKYEFKDLELAFDLALKQYKENYEAYKNRFSLDEHFKLILLRNHISNNSTIYSEKVESINIESSDVVASDLLDGVTMIEWTTANMLYHAYNEVVLKDPLSIDDVSMYHRQINWSNRKIKPGIVRNTKTNAENIEIKATGTVFVEYKEVKKQLSKLLKFINFNKTHPAVKSAIIHGYMVGIHPFNDGNGRISRFISDKYLERHIGEKIYISEAIYSNLDEYYKSLNKLHFELDPTAIVNYIIKSQINQMNLNIKALITMGDKADKIKTILINDKIIKETYIETLVYLLLNYNSLTNKTVMNNLNVTKNTAAKIIDELININLLKDGIKIGRTVVYKLNEENKW